MTQKNQKPVLSLAPLALVVLVLPLAANVDVAGDVSIEAPVAPALLALMAEDPLRITDALVTVHGDALVEDALMMQASGLSIHRVFAGFEVFYVSGPVVDIVSLRESGRVAYVSDNYEIEWYGETASVTTRAREAWDAKSTSTNAMTDGNGDVVDGRGVGVAIVDTGLDAMHPDFAGRIGANKEYACATIFLIEGSSGYDKCYGNWAANGLVNGAFDNTCNDEAFIDSDNSDDWGHGTHVAGIVAGDGTASDGRITGAAPGATLYALSINGADRVLFALEGLEWVLCHHASVTPAIKVVNNSWGAPGSYNPSDAISQAVDSLVAAGVVVVFASGNSGSGGTVGSSARSPTPGVISVANYDDAGIATRDGAITASSSRCTSAQAANECPDVAAPGTGIMAARSAFDALALPPYLPHYTDKTGTSMAAPHVAGIIAMMFQLNSGLSPADVEDILEDNAVQSASIGPFTKADASNPTSSISISAGHGLVDAIATLSDGRVGGSGGSDLPQISQNPHVYVGGADGQLVSGYQWTVPAGVSVQLSERFLESGGPAWPLSVALPCRFVVLPSTVVPCAAGGNLALDGSGPEFEMSANHAFAAGSYTVESQIDYGSGFVAFDSFSVTSV